MALTHSQAMEAVSSEDKATLEAESIDVPSFINTLIEHGCDVAPVLRVIVPMLPLSAPVKAAILSVLNVLCPL